MDEGKSYDPATERWVAGLSLGGTAGVWPQDDEVDDPICRVVGEEWAEERARLLAAAPDLLEALSAFYSLHAESDWRVPDEKYHVVTIAAAAIARATGGRR